MHDFEGWATKNDLECTDGRIIRRGAFKVQDGHKVPLVWNHQHNSPDKVLGHALLENRDEGVYAYCSFNDSPAGKDAKEAVKHGDVTALSIWANNLQQRGSEVIHGAIREVSLVLAGANPGAFIESVLTHSEPMEDGDDEGIFYTNEVISLHHAEDDKKEVKKGESESDSKDDKKEEDGETVKDVYDTLSDKQKKAVAIMVGQAIVDTKEDSKSEGKSKNEEDKEMKHNVFEEQDDVIVTGGFISHADQQSIIADAKKLGTFREALDRYLDAADDQLKHSIDKTGMDVAKGKQTYGVNDVEMLFPEYRSLNTPPEFISREMSWVQVVMSTVHRTPFSRIKSMFADITEDEARAKGYLKGNKKKDEVFTTLKRTTDPQTVYKRQKLDRDDILDITDFSVVEWIRKEMRVMLDEEIARAILIGDGRLGSSDDKIKEDHIRPVVTDVPLFNTKVNVKVSDSATSGEIAKETINTIIRSRKNYKGSGNPIFWTTEDVLTEMLLLEDGIGHKLYKTEAEVATALRVSRIVTVEPMEGMTVDELPLIGTIVNLADYNVGADKGGEVNMFDDFDIDFNQYKYLIETRCSGALVKPFSAITVLLEKAAG